MRSMKARLDQTQSGFGAAAGKKPSAKSAEGATVQRASSGLAAAWLEDAKGLVAR